MSVRPNRRIYDRREGRKSARFIDRTGMIAGRLLYLEWLGKRGRTHWWRALCDCGRSVEVMWRPANTMSCGCLQAEARRAHGWETQRTDGRWGLKNQARLVLPDGTVTTVKKLAQEVGVHPRVMAKRVERWPSERWREPAMARGTRKAVITKTDWHRRPQPWAAATTRMLNADGRAYRKTKPASAERPADPGSAGSDCPASDRRPDAVASVLAAVAVTRGR